MTDYLIIALVMGAFTYMPPIIAVAVLVRVLWLWLAYKPRSLDRLVEGAEGWEWKR